jgi:hypothetical protein
MTPWSFVLSEWGLVRAQDFELENRKNFVIRKKEAQEKTAQMLRVYNIV